jgi:hypothetical protein
MSRFNEMTEEEYLKWFDSESMDFEMFTAEGNRKAKSITRKLIKKVFSKQRITQPQLELEAERLLKEAARCRRYAEIMDTEPPYHIKYYLKAAMQIVGYHFPDLEIY